MREIVITFLICCSIGLLQAKEVRRPAFIVDGEPFPQGLTLSFEQPVTNLDSTYKSLLFDATPLVINKNDRFQLFGILGVMTEFYGDSLYAHSGGIPDNYFGAYIATNMSGAFGNNFFYQSYHSVGAFSANAELNDEGAFRYFQVTTLGKKWKQNFQTSIGLLSSTRHGDPLFLPLLKVTYAHPQFVVDVIAPVQAKVRFLFSENFHLIPYYKSSSAGFNVKGQREAIQRMSNFVGLNAERRLKGWFWAKAGLLYATPSKYTSVVDEYDKVLLESPGHLKGLIEIMVRPD